MILKHPHPALREPTFPVDDLKAAAAVADRLMAEMRASAIPAGGLAAPQIGEHQRVIVAKLAGAVTVLFNPECVRHWEELWRTAREGCLSLEDGKTWRVCRPAVIDAAWINRKGKRVTRRLHDMDARIFLHELDHLDGVLVTDRAAELERVEAEAAELGQAEAAA